LDEFSLQSENVQRPTSNVQWTENAAVWNRRWMLSVERWAFAFVFFDLDFGWTCT